MNKSIAFAQLPMRVVVSDVKHKSSHYHPNALELLFALEGEVAVTTLQKSFLLSQGECITINPGQLHCIYAKKLSTMVSIYFNIQHYQTLLPYLSGVRFNTLSSAVEEERMHYWNELRNLFIRIMLMHNKNTPAAQAIMADLAERMILSMWEQFQTCRGLPAHVLDRYYSIGYYLSQHYLEEVSVTQVAEHEGISVTRLAHFWKDTTGKSIRQTITQMRLQEAEKMLLETSYTVNEVAYHCGFSDEKYFYQHFKSYFRLTPNEYRIRHLENAQQTVRVLLSRRESERQVAAFSMKYYISGIAPTQSGLAEEECKKEAVLDQLYNGILSNTEMMITNFASTNQRIGFMQIAPDKALFRSGIKYRINWEYVYAMMHIFQDYGLTTNILVEYDCMPEEEWRPLLASLIAELLCIWGKRVVEAQYYYITSRAVPQYVGCLALADFLKKNTAVTNANAMYML